MGSFTANLGPIHMDATSAAAATRARVTRQALRAIAEQTSDGRTMTAAASLALASDADLDRLARMLK